MGSNQTCVGVCMTGSFCTFSTAFSCLQTLVDHDFCVTCIFSDHAANINTRFGEAKDFLNQAEKITGHPSILTIEDAEPIGPNHPFDLLLILPCSGNTLAKLANGITDTAVLMAAKAHLRNERPILLYISTNDGLGMNFKNIGLLMNSKDIYFIPFGQDQPLKKSHSLASKKEYLLPAIESALTHKQYQPVII